MAVGFGTPQVAIGEGVTQVDVLNVDATANPNRVIYVSFQDRANRTITSVTFDPGGANEKAGVSVGSITNVFRASLWRIEAPAAVTATVRIVYNGGTDVTACAQPCFDVDQTTPNDAPVSATGVLSPVTVDVASESGDAVIDSAVTVIEAMTVGPGQTQRANQSIPAAELEGACSTEPFVATTPITMSWTIGAGTDGWATIACNINEAGVAVAGPFTQALTGVGL